MNMVGSTIALEAMGESMHFGSVRQVMLMILAAFLSLCIQVSMVLGLKFINATSFNTIESINVFCGLIGNYFIFKAPVGNIQILGGVVIVLSCIAVSMDPTFVPKTPNRPI